MLGSQRIFLGFRPIVARVLAEIVPLLLPYTVCVYLGLKIFRVWDFQKKNRSFTLRSLQEGLWYFGWYTGGRGVPG